MWAQAVAPREESQTCPHRITLMVGTSEWPLLGRHCCRGVRLTAGEAGASQGWHSLIHSPITPVGLVFLISTLFQLIPLKTNGPLWDHLWRLAPVSKSFRGCCFSSGLIQSNIWKCEASISRLWFHLTFFLSIYSCGDTGIPPHPSANNLLIFSSLHSL